MLVILGGVNVEGIEQRLESFFGENSSMQPSGTGAYLTVGTGSQILRDLGVTKMRLLNPEVKYSALSGFDLEVVEFIPYND